MRHDTNSAAECACSTSSTVAGIATKNATRWIRPRRSGRGSRTTGSITSIGPSVVSGVGEAPEPDTGGAVTFDTVRGEAGLDDVTVVHAHVRPRPHDLEGAVEREEGLQHVLLSPETMLVFDPVARILLGHEDVVD